MKRTQVGKLSANAIALLLMAASPAPARPLREAAQWQADFVAAVGRMSTAPNFVLITAVDARSGHAWTGCIIATMLVGAILRERGLPWSAEGIAAAQRIAAGSRDHRFVFRHANALANLGLDHLDARNDEACRLIRAGQAAFMDDRSGQVYPGTPSY